MVPVNPAALVGAPSHVVRHGKTPVLAPDEGRQLLDNIDVTTPVANHASTRATQLYDRRRNEMSPDEFERLAV